MKISVYIPSMPNSFHNVSNIIEAYMNGTSIPDEIVVNLSMFNHVDSCKLEEFKNKYSFIKFIKTYNRLFAGPNRQLAKDLCVGDIILYQDDDDLPHKRRVETVKYFFENYDIMLLNHPWKSINSTIDNFNISNIKTISGDTLYDLYFKNSLEECKQYRFYGCKLNLDVHSGACAIKKELLSIVKWKSPEELVIAPLPKEKTEDFEFCFESLFYTKKAMIIDQPLYFYKQ